MSATRRARSASAPPRAGPDPLEVGVGQLEGRLPAVLFLDPDESLGAERLGFLAELVELAARKGPGPGDEQALDLAAPGDDGLEDLRGAVPADGREVAHLERHAQVGLVRAVFLHGLGVRQARERPLDLPADEREEGFHQPLVEGEEIVAVDEAHLDVDLGELGLAVGPQVLVPETADDLEIAVATRDHQGLLELLGRLGQGVEPARCRCGSGRGSRAPPRASGWPGWASRSRGSRAGSSSCGRPARPRGGGGCGAASGAGAGRGSGTSSAAPRRPGAGRRRRTAGPSRRRKSRSSSASTSTSPVGMSLLTAERRRTRPRTPTTNSSRSFLASSTSSGRSDWKTTWARPSRSRRSTKTRWPMSRVLWTQPQRTTSRPSSAARRSPQ